MWEGGSRRATKLFAKIPYKPLISLYKQTNMIHFLYVFILQFLYNSTCFERPFRSSSEVGDLLYLQLCINHANVSNWSVLRPTS